MELWSFLGSFVRTLKSLQSSLAPEERKICERHAYLAAHGGRGARQAKLQASRFGRGRDTDGRGEDGL